MEPWLRGTHTDLPAITRAVIHALELAREEADRHCAALTDTQLNARPGGVASIAFHLRHIPRSIDRLLTYAEGHALTDAQLAALNSENAPDATRTALFDEFHSTLTAHTDRIRAIDPARFEDARTVGRQQRPTTVGGLLVHIADHTQRHTGQLVTTAKLVAAQQ